MNWRMLYLLPGKTLKLPRDIYQSLTPACLDILRSLYIRMDMRAKKNPSHAMYSTVSQSTLAEYHDLTRGWVCTCIGDLSGLGLISKQQRRPVEGEPQTCLYKLGSLFLRALEYARQATSAISFTVNSTLHIVKEPNIRKNPERKKSDFPIKLKDPPLADIILRMEKLHPELV